jgi:hypothetical protein
MTARRLGKDVQYRGSVADRRGQSDYEVTVHGPGKLVEGMLAKVDFSFEIDPKARPADVEERAKGILRPYHDDLAKRSAEPWNALPRRGSAAAAASGKPSRTVTMAIRRTAGHGTFWHLNSVVPIPIPAGATLQIVFPLCFTGAALSIPAAGNPNIAIRFNSPVAPPAATGTSPTGVDVASFALPFLMHVYPFYQFTAVGAVAVTLVDCWGFGLLY